MRWERKKGKITNTGDDLERLGEGAGNGFAAQGRVERRLRGDKEGITHRDEPSEKEVELGADACTHSTEQESCLRYI